VKQKEERDMENALAWDGQTGNMDDVREAMRVDDEESAIFFQEAGRTLLRSNATLLIHRRLRVDSKRVKHWFIYECPENEVRLLSGDQYIDGETFGFTNCTDNPIFSYK
jgi:hypothetical protein